MTSKSGKLPKQPGLGKKTQQKDKDPKASYHHGDLGVTLVKAGSQMLVESGVEGLSLRKLAERVGVSRTAPYHHFKDKNALLCAIAEDGFARWDQNIQSILKDDQIIEAEKYRGMVKSYLHFSSQNPEVYELMFGRTIWKSESATPSLKSAAYPCFQHHVGCIKHWQEQGILSQTEDGLRLAQVIWGTMHGLSRLIIDGVYADVSHLDDMCDCLVNSFLVKDKLL